jgi:Rrf2 family cysteine metabolism transcriptional repressor
MFGLSTKAIYGLKAMTELGWLPEDKTLQIQEIAASRGIPQAYLEQILMLLRRANLVKSFRGATGGYALAKRPAEITLIEILEPLEGSLSILGELNYADNMGFVWSDIESALRSRLTEMTLESIVNAEKEHQDALTYVI